MYFPIGYILTYIIVSSEQYTDQEHDRAHETLFNENDNWRLTPSFLDTNSFNFSQFSHQDSTGVAPAPGAMDAMFHNKAGDLHTPGFSFQLGTPLTSSDTSMPTSAVHPLGLHTHNTQQQSLGASELDFQQAFAPSAFVHRDSGYESIGRPCDTTFAQNIETKAGGHLHAQYTQEHDNLYSRAKQIQAPSLEKFVSPRSLSKKGKLTMSHSFRYYTTLNAPTAMVKYSDEIPVTYLNKGQAYAISINDTLAPGPSSLPPRYRTVIRVSFEDKEQRQRPGSCWQLWKEGRGTAEAHQRGGRLQAVEFVDPSQNDNENVADRPRIDLEMASFDSFAVNWSPAPGSTDCNIAVRFNFLSTDFSHSKGVKGIPVRLCAKTELVSSATPESPPGPTAEVSYCKVKLFRDHGAERKLSNDIAHIKKTIEKVQQQIAQIEIGLKDGPKRKRADVKQGSHRPTKALKHKRSWSVSSQNSNDRLIVDDDLQQKLELLQDMFTSTRPVSVLHLRGDEKDDPDVFPVTLSGSPPKTSRVSSSDCQDTWNAKRSAQSTPTKALSPSSTTTSVPVTGQVSQFQHAFHRPVAHESQPQPQPEWEQLTHMHTSNYALDSTTRVPRRASADDVPRWIEASGVDHSYEPAPEISVKPAACLYICAKNANDQYDQGHHKAVYLAERTRECLVKSIATKFDLDTSSTGNILRLNPKGLKILVDDDVVREISEGQDMMVEFVTPDTNRFAKQEPQLGLPSPAATSSPMGARDQDLEIRLFF